VTERWNRETPYDEMIKQVKEAPADPVNQVIDREILSKLSYLSEGYTEAMNSEPVKGLYEALRDSHNRTYGDPENNADCYKCKALAAYEAGLKGAGPIAHIIYECGQCGSYHPWEWDGDCRDDGVRYSGPDEYAEKHGIDESGIEVRSMDERVEADSRGSD